jgi:hypothetical protein
VLRIPSHFCNAGTHREPAPRRQQNILIGENALFLKVLEEKDLKTYNSLKLFQWGT